MRRALAIAAALFVPLFILACRSPLGAKPLPTLYVTPSPIRPTATATITDTPAPTETSVPTATPSLEPTATLAGMPPESQAYLDDISPWIEVIRNGLLDFYTQQEALLNNPDLYFDQTWRLETATYAGLVMGAADNLLDIVPPPDLGAFHARTLSGTQDCSNGMETYLSALDNLNNDLLELAVTSLKSCTTKLGEATEMLQVYKDQFD